jgi:hypothetical protein
LLQGASNSHAEPRQGCGEARSQSPHIRSLAPLPRSELTTPDLKADERKAVALDIVLSYKGSLNIKLSDMGGTKVLILYRDA